MSVKQTYLSLSVLLSSESSGQGALISLSRDSDFWQKKKQTKQMIHADIRFPWSYLVRIGWYPVQKKKL